ncbi:MAG TPA: hypothetical protein PLZ38_14775 [Spirochaetota bacterium]|nr:hypothetical protein [Spirochaetota bacterium]
MKKTIFLIDGVTTTCISGEHRALFLQYMKSLIYHYRCLLSIAVRLLQNMYKGMNLALNVYCIEE